MAAGRHEDLDRARRVPDARRPRPVRLRGDRLLAGHRHARSATCRRPSTSSRATSRPRSAGGWPRPAACCWTGDAAGVAGTVHAPAAVSAPAARSPATAIVGGRTVLGRGVTRRRRRAHRQLGAARRRVGSAPARGSAARSSGPTSQIGDHCRIEGEVVLGEGVRVGSDNTLLAGIRVLPRRGAARRSDRVLSSQRKRS